MAGDALPCRSPLVTGVGLLTNFVAVDGQHYGQLFGDYWWACAEPERPFDDWQVYDEPCRLCRLKAKVDLIQGGDVRIFEVSSLPTGRRWQYKLSDLAEGVRPWEEDRLPSDALHLVYRKEGP